MTTPQVTLPPATTPDKYGGDPAAFDTAMQAWLTWMAGQAAQQNSMATWMNDQANAVASGAIAGGGIAASVSTATAMAQAAAAYAQQAAAAWSGSMAPAETLPTLSRSLHIGSVVKTIVYDTSKDSDGGAWRKRCQDKSWYTEALGGDRWIGQQATIAAAWTAAGSATGAVFQASATAGPITVGKYYAATSATTATEVFRGISREFPSVAGIVAESARVVIYDLTAPGCPMWKVIPRTGKTLVSVKAKDGKLIVGSTSGVFVEDFLTDSVGMVEKYTTTTTTPIVNATVNDVSITVLDSAPIDPSTGLPVPTIAVATEGGTSVIKHDGTVASSADIVATKSCGIRGSTLFLGARYFTADRFRYVDLTGIGASWAPVSYAYSFKKDISGANPDQIFVTPAGNSVVAVRTFTQQTFLPLVRLNPASPAASLAALVSNVYNSGWMVGDIRGAYMADTTAETITGSGELVLTPDFATDTNWTKGAGWVIGSGVATKTAGTASALSQSISAVTGRVYAFTFTHTRTAGTLTVDVSGVTVATLTTGATTTINFTAASASPTINFNGDATFAGTLDNVSVQLADPDRSVKNTGMIVKGALTKTAVASGAALVAYSGFSATNYLEQPYSTNLDFGAGDFCFMGWCNLAASDITNSAALFSRGITDRNMTLLVTSGNTRLYLGNVLTVSSSLAPVAGLNFYCVYRSGTTVYLVINGVLAGSATYSASVSLANATLRLGIDHTGLLLGFSSLALWRIGATAPSTDQIAHIYRTELALFQPGAQCTIAGSSAAVTALAYDDTTDLLHVGTSWGRSGFKDLLRVDAEATTTGALTSLSSIQGVILTGGTSAKVYVPAQTLREELRRKDEARAALGKVPVFFDFTATASQTAFTLPKGYTAKALYKNGTLMRETTTGVYWTRSNDGFQETCTLSVGATVSDWISVMATRNY